MPRLTLDAAVALAEGHLAAGRIDQAEQLCRLVEAEWPAAPQTLRLRARLAAGWGDFCGYGNRWAEAEAAYRRACQAQPDEARHWTSLGMALGHQGKVREAVEACRRAVALAPDSFWAQNNLAAALQMSGELNEAESALRRAVELNPDNPDALNNVAVVVGGKGRLVEAEQWCRRALSLNPRHAHAWNNLGMALREQGRAQEALACHLRSVEADPSLADVASNALLCRQYCPGVRLDELYQAHVAWNNRYATGLAAAAGPARRQPGPLRIGFVSGDFRRHPVAAFFLPLVQNLDRRRCRTFCYFNHPQADDQTATIRAAAGEWRDVRTLTDAALTEQVRADRVDVLVDLSGHTAGNRLLCFARKPAPLQATWLGYESTTGLSAIDCIVADAVQIVAGEERFFSERVLRMPNGYVCWQPPAEAPPVAEPPARRAGEVTFGSFNNLGKITAEVVATWAEILCRLPRSRLLLKYKSFSDADVRRRFWELFAAGGVAAERVEILGQSSYDEVLACYARVDVALDPFPYSGSMTTCEALWMGLPMVTIRGETFAGRDSAGHLTRLGLGELVVDSREGYVRRAVELAGEPDRLAELRRSMRPRMADSPLCDGRRFAGDFLDLLAAAAGAD